MTSEAEVGLMSRAYLNFLPSLLVVSTNIIYGIMTKEMIEDLLHI